MVSEAFYRTLGMFSVFTVGMVLLAMAVFVVLGVILLKKRRVYLPRLLLFIVDNLYFPLKWATTRFGVSDRIVDRIGVEARNFSQRERFSKVDPGKRILLLPHCLRHLKCPAKLNPKVGVTCIECGLCKIKDLKIQSEKLGYTVVIAPGSGFVKRKMKEVRPDAALCVACYKDLNHVMQSISRSKIPVIGVPLTRDGCVETSVDYNQLIKSIDMMDGTKAGT